MASRDASGLMPECAAEYSSFKHRRSRPQSDPGVFPGVYSLSTAPPPRHRVVNVAPPAPRGEAVSLRELLQEHSRAEAAKEEREEEQRYELEWANLWNSQSAPKEPPRQEPVQPPLWTLVEARSRAQLSKAVLVHCFGWLNAAELAGCDRVARRWRSAADTPALWEAQCIQCGIGRGEGIGWREHFIANALRGREGAVSACGSPEVGELAEYPDYSGLSAAEEVHSLATAYYESAGHVEPSQRRVALLRLQAAALERRAAKLPRPCHWDTEVASCSEELQRMSTVAGRSEAGTGEVSSQLSAMSLELQVMAGEAEWRVRAAEFERRVVGGVGGAAGVARVPAESFADLECYLMLTGGRHAMLCSVWARFKHRFDLEAYYDARDAPSVEAARERSPKILETVDKYLRLPPATLRRHILF
eukprot:Hpha_TRINITY_DN31584_c0_g1::TRINITY_DN31584_c0_g1_i1::g.1720::m.1720